MDIHKPKPWHGLREFLKEYAIIVVGVLTALALEQTVEWLHWTHEVKAERASLLDDAKYVVGTIRYRQHQKPCIDLRLREVHALLERHAADQPLGLTGPIGPHVRGGATIGTWDVAVAGQVLSHMSDAERLSFSDAFSIYKSWNEETAHENAIWGRMMKLNEPDLLNNEGWSDITDAYWAAQQVAIHLDAISDLILRRDALGLPDEGPTKPTGAFADAEAAMCRPFVVL